MFENRLHFIKEFTKNKAGAKNKKNNGFEPMVSKEIRPKHWLEALTLSISFFKSESYSLPAPPWGVTAVVGLKTSVDAVESVSE